MTRVRSWSVASVDLDWVSPHPETVPHNGYEILADYLDKGGQVLAAWWEPLPGGGRSNGGFARVLVRVPEYE